MSDDPDYMYALELQQQLNDGSSDSDTDTEQLPKDNTKQKSNEDNDYQLALKLQAELDAEEINKIAEDCAATHDDILALDMSTRLPKSTKKSNMQPPAGHNNNYLDQTQNLVHPEWELIDPSPDIFAMFMRFDEKFFQKRLGAVMVEWSKRMYSCAGICYQRGNRYVKEIIIRLSEPLLKLRPRKDLVETLLHEMIHAYCFVLNIREGNGGHGPNFKRIMETINKVAGTNITVYHSFHDEVDAYKTHIWRCNGICQYHNPFQGWVKRTSNRAPGPNDQWWSKHQRECGGTFEKKSAPNKPAAAVKGVKPAKQLKNESTSNVDDIRNYFGKPKPKSITIVPKVQPAAGLASAFPPTSYPGLSSDPFTALQTNNAAKKKPGNIMGFKDLAGSSDEDKPDAAPANEMPGQGYSLTGNSKSSSAQPPAKVSRQIDHVRELWSKRFAKSETVTIIEDSDKNKDEDIPVNASKRRRINTELDCWESYDEDVMVRDVVPSVISISDSEDDLEQLPPKQTAAAGATKPLLSSQQRTINIKREVMEEESLYSDDDIFMIDDEYDDVAGAAANLNDITAAAELADQSIIDDLFGEDTLLQEFQRENDVLPSGSRYQHDERNDITTCPICFEKMKRSEFANHLEGCSIVIKVLPASVKGRTTINVGNSRSINNKAKTATAAAANKRKSTRRTLKSCGYTPAEIAALDLSSSGGSGVTSEEDLTPRQRRQRNLFKPTTECPRCGQELMGHQLEAHRDICKRKTP